MQPRAFFITLILLIVCFNIIIFLKFNADAPDQESITANVVMEDNADPDTGGVEIPKKDLKQCCTFERDGKEQSCFVLATYDCSFCDQYCS